MPKTNRYLLSTFILFSLAMTSCRQSGDNKKACEEEKENPPQQKLFAINAFQGDEKQQFLEATDIFAPLPAQRVKKLTLASPPELVSVEPIGNGVQITARKVSCEKFVESNRGESVKDGFAVSLETKCGAVVTANIQVKILPRPDRNCFAEQVTPEQRTTETARAADGNQASPDTELIASLPAHEGELFR